MNKIQPRGDSEDRMELDEALYTTASSTCTGTSSSVSGGNASRRSLFSSGGQIMNNRADVETIKERMMGNGGSGSSNETELSIFSKDMNSFTSEEREKILHELHGVADAAEVNETPELLSRSLAELASLWEDELGTPTNTLLRLAETQYPKRVNDPNFRLMFLRADEFNAQQAMTRILLHLEQQQFLFGDSKVGKRITLQDMKEIPETWEALQDGYAQILLERDRSGRVLYFESLPHKFSKGIVGMKCSHQVGYYLIMAELERSVAAQQRGVVAILSYLGKVPIEILVSRLLKTAALVKCLPMKICGAHSCIDPSSNQKVLEQFLRFRNLWQSKTVRAHSRTHLGTWIECSYALMTFGIPQARLPLDSHGEELQRDDHMEWLRRQERLDGHGDGAAEQRSVHDSSNSCASASSATTSMNTFGRQFLFFQKQRTTMVIEKPAPNDVLFGRGRNIQEHPGNVAFIAFIDSLLPEYDRLSDRKGKTDFSQKVVTRFQQETGGRFLKPLSLDPEQWEEADPSAARSKVSFGFRSRRFRLERAGSRTKKGTSSSSAAATATNKSSSTTTATSSSSSSSSRLFTNLCLTAPGATSTASGSSAAAAASASLTMTTIGTSHEHHHHDDDDEGGLSNKEVQWTNL